VNHKTSIMFYYCSIIPLFSACYHFIRKCLFDTAGIRTGGENLYSTVVALGFIYDPVEPDKNGLFWYQSQTVHTSRYLASVTKVHQDLRHQSHGVNKLGLIIEKIILGKTKMLLGWRWEMTTFRCWYDSESE
jgi:hypothetical protein